MGHFRESSYAYLLFKHCTILTTINSTTSIHKGKATVATINAKKISTLFLPVTCKGEDISTSRRARELILGSNWGRIQFPIHWCTLNVWWPHHGRTLTVRISPISALVTKLAFSVSIGWQPIVPPPYFSLIHFYGNEIYFFCIFYFLGGIFFVLRKLTHMGRAPNILPYKTVHYTTLHYTTPNYTT